jgi:uridine kinase
MAITSAGAGLDIPVAIRQASAVLISGPTGAGKSSVAQAVSRATGGVCFPLDNFFLDASDMPVEDLPDIGLERLWDSPESYDWAGVRCCLNDLVCTGTATVPEYSFEVNARVGASRISASAGCQVIVDGIYGFAASPVLEGLGLKTIRVFVTAELDIRFSRVLQRDAAAWARYPEHAPKRRRTLAAAERRWILTQRQAADFVIDTSEGFPPWVREAAAP